MVRIFSQYISPKSLLLMAIEGFLIAASLMAAVKLRFWNDPLEFEIYTAFPDFGVQILIILIALQSCFHYNDLYDLTVVRRRSELLIRLAQAIGAACLVLGLLYYAVPRLLLGRWVFLITMLLLSGSIMLIRVGLDAVWRVAAPPERVLILGSGPLATRVNQELARREDLNVEVVGFVHPGQARQTPDAAIPDGLLIAADDLDGLPPERRPDRIIVALEDRRGTLPIRELVTLRVQGIRVEDASSALASLTGHVWLEALRPSWFVFSQGFRRSRPTLLLKRLIDLSASIVGLLVSAPVMFLTAIAIRLESPGPVLYRQVRVGRGGRRFVLLKFRSMREDAEEQNGPQWAEEDDPRITRLGRFLRKYRLDELPQFWNVIAGDMSFVGPRPERPVFVQALKEKIPYYDERHSVRPGITGWAQVRYGYGSTVEDAVRKLEYDLFYLQNVSLAFDCAIIFHTLRIVLFGRGAR